MKKGISISGKCSMKTLCSLIALSQRMERQQPYTCRWKKGANGKEVADKIRKIVKEEKETNNTTSQVTRLPVTHSGGMFKAYGHLRAYCRDGHANELDTLCSETFFLSITLMMDAMISIVWSMGLLIWLGFPIHIMSSMAPVFLMAIATDSMHIFNEFYFRYRETKDKKKAIIETMQAVSRPVRYAALATAAGFAVLLFMNIVRLRSSEGLSRSGRSRSES